MNFLHQARSFLPRILTSANVSKDQQESFNARKGISLSDGPRSELKLQSPAQAESTNYDVEKLIKSANDAAVHGSGQVYELYEKNLQASYASILANAPAAHRAATETALLEHGYEPDFVPYQAQPGECSLTGVDVNHCPCGHHE